MNVHFKPNEPQTLALQEPRAEQFGDYEITYTLTDGRLLKVSKAVAAAINELDLQPGETFGICKQMVFNEQRRRETPSWTVWLTPESEHARAKQEMQPPMTLSDVKRPKIRSIRKTAATPSQQTALTFDRGTGTYGAVPLPHTLRPPRNPLQRGLQRGSGLRHRRIEAGGRTVDRPSPARHGEHNFDFGQQQRVAEPVGALMKIKQILPTSPNVIEALALALRDVEITREKLRELLSSANRHGDLQVALSAIRRIETALQVLIEAEERP